MGGAAALDGGGFRLNIKTMWIDGRGYQSPGRCWLSRKDWLDEKERCDQLPRKGGIFKREYWQPYVPTKDNKWPDFDFIIVSVHSAFTEKEENDPTGCTTWGVWTDPPTATRRSC